MFIAECSDQICRVFSPLQLLPTLHNLFFPVSLARVHSMDSVLPGCAHVHHSHPSPIASQLLVGFLSLPDLCPDVGCCRELLSSRWWSAADIPPLSVPEAVRGVPFRAIRSVSYAVWLNHLRISVLISVYSK